MAENTISCINIQCFGCFETEIPLKGFSFHYADYVRASRSISNTLGHYAWPPAAIIKGHKSHVGLPSYQPHGSWVNQGSLSDSVQNTGFRQLMLCVRGAQPFNRALIAHFPCQYTV